MRNVLLLSALFAFLTGCFSKPKPPEPIEPAPTAPGTSAPLHYPVVLLSSRTLYYKANADELLTTKVASGMWFPEYMLLDSDGMYYDILKQTEFGKKSPWLDMGTSSFQVYLKLKSLKKVDLAEAKELVLKSAITPYGPASTPKGEQIARETVGASRSVAELVQACENSWNWR